jgi:hypothetical protein
MAAFAASVCIIGLDTALILLDAEFVWRMVTLRSAVSDPKQGGNKCGDPNNTNLWTLVSLRSKVRPVPLQKVSFPQARISS